MEKHYRYIQIANVLLGLASLLAITHALRLLGFVEFDKPQDLFTPAVMMGLMGILLHAWSTRKLNSKDLKSK